MHEAKKGGSCSLGLLRIYIFRQIMCINKKILVALSSLLKSFLSL